MNFDILKASMSALNVEQQSQPTDFGTLLVVFLLMAAFIVLIFGGYYIWTTIEKRSKHQHKGK